MTVQDIRLNDGNSIPAMGLGTWKMDNHAAAAIVGGAIRAGYRAIDTAAMYGNEEGVGAAVRAADARVFVTSKVWFTELGYDRTLAAFEASHARLGLDVIDLFLIHWPAPRRGLFADSWKALVRLREEGRVRSIGVSNFSAEQIERIVGETGVVPAANQIELHPHFQQKELRAFHAEQGIATICWSPLGQGGVLNDPAIGEVAAKHGRSPAQVVLRWHLQSGLIPIPKSAEPPRQAENLGAFAFALDDEDMARIAALDRADGRYGPHPDNLN